MAKTKKAKRKTTKKMAAAGKQIENTKRKAEEKKSEIKFEQVIVRG